jgi:DNA-binding MarR family transcriptional regulator
VDQSADEGTAPRLPGLGSEQEQAWELYVHSHALLQRALDAELRAEHGISLLTLDALVQLSRAPGRAMYMKDLAAALVYSASGITRIVDNLERSGHVTRNPDPTNRRATLVKLTPQGRRALESAWAPHVRGVQRWFAQHVDAAQAKVLVEVFGAVAQDLEPSGSGSV